MSWLEGASAVGFDMDDTLAIYRRDAFQEATIAVALELLVARGYPPEVARLAYDLEIGMRGLLIDRRRGNVLKVAADGTVERAYHGHRRLTDDEIRAQYAKERDLGPGVGYFEIETFFSVPISVLFSALIEAARTGPAARPHLVLRDVVAAVTDAIGSWNAARVAGGGLDDHLERDGALRRTLEALRARGKRLFLLTNSGPDYTLRVMGWLLEGGPWTQLFDAIVTDAGKPGFFTGDAPFGSAGAGLLTGGNARALEARLAARGPEVLYLGDHPHDDVIAPRQAVGWRTALIAPELGAANRHWGHVLHEGGARSALHRRIEAHTTLIAGRVPLLLRLEDVTADDGAPGAG